MTLTASETLVSAVETAVASLIAVEHHPRGSLVTLPVRYPSGATVVLQVTEAVDKYFVTDMGHGSYEADLIGARRLFDKLAGVIAREAGIRYDGDSLFVAEIEKSRLSGALLAVSSCSQQAANGAALKQAERADRESKYELFDYLRDVFRGSDVERDAAFRGASSHEWHVAVLIRDAGRSAMFEAVNAHHTSVVNTAAKFADIGRLETPPPRVAVVKSKAALGNFLGVLAPTTSALIEFSAAPRLFRDVSHLLAA